MSPATRRRRRRRHRVVARTRATRQSSTFLAARRANRRAGERGSLLPRRHARVRRVQTRRARRARNLGVDRRRVVRRGGRVDAARFTLRPRARRGDGIDRPGRGRGRVRRRVLGRRRRHLEQHGPTRGFARFPRASRARTHGTLRGTRKSTRMFSWSWLEMCQIEEITWKIGTYSSRESYSTNYPNAFSSHLAHA